MLLDSKLVPHHIVRYHTIQRMQLVKDTGPYQWLRNIYHCRFYPNIGNFLDAVNVVKYTQKTSEETFWEMLQELIMTVTRTRGTIATLTCELSGRSLNSWYGISSMTGRRKDVRCEETQPPCFLHMSKTVCLNIVLSFRSFLPFSCSCII